MKKCNLIFLCAIGLINLTVTSCGKKNADATEQEKVEQTTESATNNSSDESSAKSNEDKKEIEIKIFDFSTITESNATIGEFPYLKDIPGFKIDSRI